MLLRSVSVEKKSLQNRGLLQILKNNILSQRGFQCLSGRGINATNVREFQQSIIENNSQASLLKMKFRALVLLISNQLKFCKQFHPDFYGCFQQYFRF